MTREMCAPRCLAYLHQNEGSVRKMLDHVRLQREDSFLAIIAYISMESLNIYLCVCIICIYLCKLYNYIILP